MEHKINSTLQNLIPSGVISSLRRFVSPLFVVMLVASFIFWFVTKLGNHYTTELQLTMRVEDQRFKTTCVVEGVGTNLLGYHINHRSAMKIDLADVKYRTIKSRDGETLLRIDNSSLSSAISIKYSDIKLVSITNIPDLEITEAIKEHIEKSKK